ncbi:MAG TPA: CHAP domain-containing protein [Candidatus Saccharimonadales bacterium]|nr:CHAP domain-containing protein [Candidatus Saccharimonadales bacterium]
MVHKTDIFHAKIRASLKRVAGYSALVIAALAMMCSSTLPVYADQYDDQINALKQQQAQSQAQANQLGAQANDLQGQINVLENQIASVRAQIAANQQRYNDLSGQIDVAKKELAHQREVLGKNIKAMYIEGKVSTVEMLASSKNISEYLDKQQYRNTVKDKISDTIVSIKDLEKQLADQQAEVVKLLDTQKTLQADLAAKQSEADQKLAQTNQAKSQFDTQVADLAAQIGQLKSAQAQMYANLSAGGSSIASKGAYGSLQWRNKTAGVNCGGGYDSQLCSAYPDSIIDSWQLYNRECVSYAAWAMQYRFGHHVSGFHGAGNAYQWPGTVPANGDGYTDETPASGSVVIIPPSIIGGVGHAAVVEQVYGDGWIRVSQYNFDPYAYSTMDLKVVSGLAFVHFTH